MEHFSITNNTPDNSSNLKSIQQFKKKELYLIKYSCTKEQSAICNEIIVINVITVIFP